MRDTVFKYIKASKFFPKYAPGVANYQHKLRGVSGINRPLDFTDSDKAMIKRGVEKLYVDLHKTM